MVLFDLSTVYSRIRLRGKTRLDFLHRMSTAAVLDLTPGAGKPTVLTTPIGRMVDYLIVLAFDDAALLLGGGSNQDKVARWLRKYIFFNDDVQVDDESAITCMVGVGAEDGQLLIERLAADASVSALPPYAHCSVRLPAGSGRSLTIVRAPQALSLSFFVIGEAIDQAQISEVLGLPPDVLARMADRRSNFDAWRIHHAYPRFPNEINEEYIPLEAGLWSAVSFNKGCYTGQEIIARMESRGQIARKLVWLTGDDVWQPGDALLADTGEVVGKLTSTTPGAALGYLRTAWAVEGASLRTQGGTEVRVAKIVRI